MPCACPNHLVAASDHSKVLEMTRVFLSFTEAFVVLNQGEQYLEGYLAKKPKHKYAAIETELEQTRKELKQPKAVSAGLFVAVEWDERFVRGEILEENL